MIVEFLKERRSNYRLSNKNCNLLIVKLEMKDLHYQDKDETLMLDRCCKLSGTSNCSLCVSFLSWHHQFVCIVINQRQLFTHKSQLYNTLFFFNFRYILIQMSKYANDVVKGLTRRLTIMFSTKHKQNEYGTGKSLRFRHSNLVIIISYFILFKKVDKRVMNEVK